MLFLLLLRTTFFLIAFSISHYLFVTFSFTPHRICSFDSLSGDIRRKEIEIAGAALGWILNDKIVQFLSRPLFSNRSHQYRQ